MSKLNEQGLATLVEEINRSVNTKINESLGGGGGGDLTNYITRTELESIISNLATNSSVQENIDSSKLELQNIIDTTNTTVDILKTKVDNSQNYKMTQDSGAPFLDGVANLNDAKFTRERKCIVDPNSISAPNSTDYWYVECMGNNDFAKQEATTYAVSDPKKYFRVRINTGTWSEWREL